MMLLLRVVSLFLLAFLALLRRGCAATAGVAAAGAVEAEGADAAWARAAVNTTSSERNGDSTHEAGQGQAARLVTEDDLAFAASHLHEGMESERKAVAEAMQARAEAEALRAQERQKIQARFDDRFSSFTTRSSPPGVDEGGAVLMQTQSEQDAQELRDLADQLIEHESYGDDDLKQMYQGMDADRDERVSEQDLLDFWKHMRNETAFYDILEMKRGRKTVFGDLDANGDGRVSFSELPDGGDHQYATELFKAADADDTGFLEPLEVPALYYPELSLAVTQVVALVALKKRDVDGDGLLTMEELFGPFLEMEDKPVEDFRWLDKDGNGKLDSGEFAAFENRNHRSHQALQALLRLADRDGDAHMTLAEFQAVRRKASHLEAHHILKAWAEHYMHAPYGHKT